ncbi:hypothetical protein [Campylobacter concisus]|jgi:hypothetical protein|uniref:Uncharacterized protein n=1 Tax=Campylobacter concisus TaxID=199 RepID=A0A7S9RUN9_9BACT|nr:hypothetical protein [Campylobacter concisus]QPH98052.1 hypothetical protein CVS89_07315 [Campylobacter concisus]QPI05247.1 hypothetical protein G5B99_07125 [Campylobacter concisus]
MKISEILQTIFWLGLLIYIASVTVPDQAAHRRAMIEAFESVRQPKAQTLEGLLANEFLKEISIAYGIDGMFCKDFDLFGLKLGTRCTVETSKLAVDTYGAFGMVFAYKQPTH